MIQDILKCNCLRLEYWSASSKTGIWSHTESERHALGCWWQPGTIEPCWAVHLTMLRQEKDGGSSGLLFSGTSCLNLTQTLTRWAEVSKVSSWMLSCPTVICLVFPKQEWRCKLQSRANLLRGDTDGEEAPSALYGTDMGQNQGSQEAVTVAFCQEQWPQTLLAQAEGRWGPAPW